MLWECGLWKKRKICNSNQMIHSQESALALFFLKDKYICILSKRLCLYFFLFFQGTLVVIAGRASTYFRISALFGRSIFFSCCFLTIPVCVCSWLWQEGVERMLSEARSPRLYPLTCFIPWNQKICILELRTKENHQFGPLLRDRGWQPKWGKHENRQTGWFLVPGLFGGSFTNRSHYKQVGVNWSHSLLWKIKRLLLNLCSISGPVPSTLCGFYHLNLRTWSRNYFYLSDD